MGAERSVRIQLRQFRSGLSSPVRPKPRLPKFTVIHRPHYKPVKARKIFVRNACLSPVSGCKSRCSRDGTMIRSHRTKNLRCVRCARAGAPAMGAFRGQAVRPLFASFTALPPPLCCFKQHELIKLSRGAGRQNVPQGIFLPTCCTVDSGKFVNEHCPF